MPGKQAVAGHRHEDPRLAQEEHQQHAGHARQAAGRDQHGRHRSTGSVFRVGRCPKATAIGALMSMSGYRTMPVITAATAM